VGICPHRESDIAARCSILFQLLLGLVLRNLMRLP
jgi:hypothetical protein